MTATTRRMLFSMAMTVLLSLIIVLWVHPQTLLQRILDIGGLATLWISCLYFATIVLRALRFRIADPLERQHPLLTLVGITMLHQFLTHVLPARTGEASFPLLMKKVQNVSMARSTTSLVIIRIHEAFVLGVLFTVALCFHLFPPSSLSGWLSVSTLIPAALSAIALLVLRALPALLGKAATLSSRVSNPAALRMKAFRAKVAGFIEAVGRESQLHQRSRTHFAVFALSMIIWLNNFFIFQQIMKACGVEMDMSIVIMGSALANFTQAIPVNTFGSFGTMEAGWTLGFALVGIDARTAMSAALILHALIIVLLSTGAALAWIAIPGLARQKVEQDQSSTPRACSCRAAESSSPCERP